MYVCVSVHNLVSAYRVDPVLFVTVVGYNFVFAV